MKVEWCRESVQDVFVVDNLIFHSSSHINISIHFLCGLWKLYLYNLYFYQFLHISSFCIYVHYHNSKTICFNYSDCNISIMEMNTFSKVKHQNTTVERDCPDEGPGIPLFIPNSARCAAPWDAHIRRLEELSNPTRFQAFFNSRFINSSIQVFWW